MSILKVFCKNDNFAIKLLRTSGVRSVSAKSALRRFDYDIGDQVQKHWRFERILAASLAVAIPAGLAYPTPLLDNLASTLIVVHSHLGMEQVILDYFHYRPKIIYYSCMALVYLGSTVALTGLIYFNYTNVGLFNAVKQLWSINAEK